MFLLNSCLGQSSAARLLHLAPLLPKLRGHFAEFLGNASSAGLGILSPSTCVGLRYGPVVRHSGFSRQALLALRYPYVCSASRLRLYAGVFPPAWLLRLHRSFLSRHAFCARVPTFLVPRGTGISTCCPSATPCGLALGPDLPREDKLYPGNLGYSADRIPTYLSLLIPAFSLHAAPLLLAVQLRRSMDAPLPIIFTYNSTASVLCFSPGHFRRRDSRLVGCYALFECMAASKPTS